MGKFVFKFFIFIIFIIFMMLKIDINVVVSCIDSKLIFSFLFIQPFIFISLIMAAMRYSILIWFPPASFWASFKAVILSDGLNLILPNRISEFIKPVYMNFCTGISIIAGLAAVFLERLMDLIILGLLAILSMLFLSKISNSYLIIIIALASIIFFLTLPYLESYYIKALSFLPIKFIRDLSQKFLFYISTRTRQKNFYKSIFFTFLSWGSAFAGTSVFLYIVSDGNINLGQALILFTGLTVGIAIPIIPGGFGTYEAIVITILKNIGYSYEQSLIIALSLHLSQISMSVIIAFIITITGKLSFTEITNKVKEIIKI